MVGEDRVVEVDNCEGANDGVDDARDVKRRQDHFLFGLSRSG